MRKYSMFYVIIALFTLLIFSAEGNCFAGASDIKARMQQRKPTIDMLKSEALVGENNKGYLEFVPGAARKRQVLFLPKIMTVELYTTPLPNSRVRRRRL